MTKNPGEDKLLNIDQAANMLNVSKASLRRWTDSGKMPCYRVGAQKARRFKREELVAFISGGQKVKQAGVSEVQQHGSVPRHDHQNGSKASVSDMDIEYGHHICTLYGRAVGRLKMAVPLIGDGLKAGDVCFLVAPDDTREHYLEGIQKVYPDIAGAIDSKQLVFPNCESNKDKMLGMLEEEFLKATYSGSRKLRLVGDMHWALVNGWDQQELYEFELEYNNTLGHRFPVISLCQYDVEHFSGRGVLDALKSHEDTYHYPISNVCF